MLKTPSPDKNIRSAKPCCSDSDQRLTSGRRPCSLFFVFFEVCIASCRSYLIMEITQNCQQVITCSFAHVLLFCITSTKNKHMQGLAVSYNCCIMNWQQNSEPDHKITRNRHATALLILSVCCLPGPRIFILTLEIGFATLHSTKREYSDVPSTLKPSPKAVLIEPVAQFSLFRFLLISRQNGFERANFYLDSI